MSSSSTTLIIGAAGAIGKRLCAALSKKGNRVIASDRMEHLPGSLKRDLGPTSVTVGNVDVRSKESLYKLFQEHADENTTVWNLAAPLSVETAMDPGVAESVTIGGMRNVLEAMETVGARRICFTDSIGSFGATAPRSGATAKWLIENPTQDPGSDYGIQKRGCRELMAKFAAEKGGDPRFAVLPGVLHSEPIWGNGTTEYALDALIAASKGDSYTCPVELDVQLPMIYVDDLMNGLIALQEADEATLTEPQRGYCVPGLSFSPNQLFTEIQKYYPTFQVDVQLDENMNKFAHLWPNDLSTIEPKRDLGYSPKVGLSEMVKVVLNSHSQRQKNHAHEFATLDGDGDGFVTRGEMENFIRRHIVEGRESGGYVFRRQDGVDAILDKTMNELDTNNDGLISLPTFLEWSRANSLKGMVTEHANEMLKRSPSRISDSK
jgi:threonine 3-dehydrogenase